jgi:hypothetical protein
MPELTRRSLPAFIHLPTCWERKTMSRFLFSYMVVLGVAVLWLLGGAPAKAQAPQNPCTGFGVQKLSLAWNNLPVSFSGITGQTGADCMAWQEFIALNWKADPAHPGQPDRFTPASTFGTPGDTSPTVWESYFKASTLFNSATGANLLWAAFRPQIHNLSQLSAFGVTNLSSIAQADNNKWLTNQRGGLTYYDIGINEDEFDFIVFNQFHGSNLTTYAGQLACAEQPGKNGRGGFHLPAGGNGIPFAKLDTDCMGNPTIYGQNVGAIEVKSAWTALPADHSLDYRYLTAVANVMMPDGTQQQQTVGLVGLHILHKVPGAQQWVWATFEQIDNDPDDANDGASYSAPTLPSNANQQPRPGYTYFNPSCTPQTDQVFGCVHNEEPGAACSSQSQPSAGCFSYSAPMQITRLVPVDEIANSVTGYTWSLLPAKSVFNYYRLIDVQWPSKSIYTPPGSRPPLLAGDITPAPSTKIVSNTTMETYFQSQNSCTSCHSNTPIALNIDAVLTQVNGVTSRKNVLPGMKVREVILPGLKLLSSIYASDYSFLFFDETTH